MTTLLAALPVLAVLGLMLGLRWPAARAGVVVALGTAVLAVAVFDFGRGDSPYGVDRGVLGVLAEAGFITLTIVAIIGPALGIHHLQSATGATPMLEAALRRISPDPRVVALLIAWFFALFMEGAAGFGTSVALAAPFLVAAGFMPVSAVVAAMIGHVVGVSFGAIGTPVAAQMAISGLSGLELARSTALFHVVLGWVLVLVVLRVITGDRQEATPWRIGLLAGVSFLVPYGLIAAFVGPELPTLGGAVLGTVAFIVVIRRRTVAPSAPSVSPVSPASCAADLEAPSRRLIALAAAPYLVLIAVVLVTRLVAPIEDALRSVTIDWQLESTFTGSVMPLYHPGLLLTAAFFIGAAIQGARPSQVAGALVAATRQLATVTVALVSMVTIARLMSQSGMTADLADAAARTGAGWPLISPAVGALGTFVTGSATASNVLFTELQIDTAAARGLDVTTMLGAQGFGAAVGNAIAPHNIVAAAATVGLAGRESEILRRTLPVTAGYLALGGALAWVLTA